VKVDSDGDGIFEHIFASDSMLTRDEFLSQTAIAGGGGGRMPYMN
jgi:hypothetical protein